MQKQSSGKKNKNERGNIYIGNLSLDTEIDDLYELFDLRSTKYLKETCRRNMPVNENAGKCKGFAFGLVPEHVQKEILQLNGITLENRIIVIEDATYTRKRDTKNLQKASKRPLVVTNKHPENQDVFSSSKLSAGMKTYVGTIRSKEKKKSYIIGDSHLNRIRKDKFKDSTPKARVYVESFSGPNTNQLDYYVVPLLVDEKPDNVVIHIGSNDITKFNYNNVNAEELTHRIINIGLKCRSYGLSNIAVFSILKRSIFNINQVIYQVNNILKRLCRINDFSYICNDLVNDNYLWKDGFHPANEGSSPLTNYFINYLNGNGNNGI